MELDDKHQKVRELAVSYWRARLLGDGAFSDAASNASKEIDRITETCSECCDQCSAIFCPYDEPLHGHHDGCPCCDTQIAPRDATELKVWRERRWMRLIGKNSMRPEQPTVKAIEGMRIKPGDTLVMIPERNLTLHQFERLNSDCQMVGLKLLYLPAGTKLYIKES